MTNIPTDSEEPPQGEPWTYYLFAHLVIVRQREIIRYRYIEVCQGGTYEAVAESLLELVTRPGVKWLEPDAGEEEMPA